jgi:predicted AlkP superfamily phosphohydrolase/phosphomutase
MQDNHTCPRVLVIGLAEATLDLILPWVQAGRLPAFQRLIEEGVHGPLRSRLPLVTPQMWGTVFTGISAGRHGAFDFWQRGANGRFREINGAILRQKRVWQLLAEYGLSSGIVNMPFTYPPQPFKGYLIAGEDAPGAHPSIASPPQLYDEITARFGRYRLKDIFPGGREKSDYLTLPQEDVEKQTAVLEYLVRQHPTDFFMTFYSATAICQHYFWSDMLSQEVHNPYRGVVESAYRALDAAIDRLMQAAGPEARIFVISECGAGPLQSGVNINAWLAREGFLNARALGRSSGALREGWLRTAVAGARKQVQGRLQNNLPDSMYYLVNRYLAGPKAWVQSYVVNSGIDWAHTRAFSRGKEGHIYINRKGRDPRGIVEPRDYERVWEAIVERLYALVDPATGEHAVDRVYRASELYAGPLQDTAPDITIAWRDGLYCPHEGKYDEAVFVTRWREYMNWPTSGGHRLDGILFAKGPGIPRGRRIAGARIEDLVPTWLHAFKRPLPGYLEGRVIPGIFESAP